MCVVFGGGGGEGGRETRGEGRRGRGNLLEISGRFKQINRWLNITIHTHTHTWIRPIGLQCSVT